MARICANMRGWRLPALPHARNCRSRVPNIPIQSKAGVSSQATQTREFVNVRFLNIPRRSNYSNIFWSEEPSVSNFIFRFQTVEPSFNFSLPKSLRKISDMDLTWTRISVRLKPIKSLRWKRTNKVPLFAVSQGTSNWAEWWPKPYYGVFQFKAVTKAYSDNT